MLASTRFTKVPALREKIKRMVHYIKIQHIFSTPLDLHNPWIAKFKYFFTIGTYQMVVLLVFVSFFKLSHVFTKLVLNDQPSG